ncbi:MAG: hypothetical protein WBL50_20910 [Candidatus Acidiferrum sp.]|jgi:hypothetical protein
MNPVAEVTDFAGSTSSNDNGGAKWKTTLPEPLSLPWELKPLSSARSGLKTLEDGRRCFWVDEFLKGIASKMLVWWFSHLEGEVEIGGRLLSRYRVFHPFDHCGARYVRRMLDGSIGPGAQIRICEFIARNPRYKTEVTATIEKLDESGFINNVVVGGLTIVRMEHDFHETEGGTRFEHRLITPGNTKLWLLAKPISAFMFPNPKGQAWLKHAIEEMGSLENFLPQLYESELVRTNPATSKI